MNDKIINCISKNLYPLFIRELKERGFYPYALKKKLNEVIPSINVGEKYKYGVFNNINDVVNFEIAYFNSPSSGFITLFGKRREDFKNIDDIIKFVAFFVFNDVVDKIVLNDKEFSDIIHKILKEKII